MWSAYLFLDTDTDNNVRLTFWEGPEACLKFWHGARSIKTLNYVCRILSAANAIVQEFRRPRGFLWSIGPPSWTCDSSMYFTAFKYTGFSRARELINLLTHRMELINTTLKFLSLLSIVCFADIVLASGRHSAASIELGPSTFTAPGSFPTSLFERYYNNPTATSEQPQPVITDPISVSLDRRSTNYPNLSVYDF